MGDPEPVKLPKRLPESVEIPDNPGDLGITPRELGAIKKASGVRLDYLMGDDSDLDEKVLMMVWLLLRRQGFDVSWDEARDVRPIGGAEPPDPTSGEASTTSPHSADSGA